MAGETPDTISPIKAGFLCRCPRCGRGRLFSRYLVVVSVCKNCGLDLSAADTGDGPAVFVMFIVGFVVVGAALLVEMRFHPGPLLHLALWIPSVLALSLILLPPFKAVLIALQYKHQAKEGRLDDD